MEYQLNEVVTCELRTGKVTALVKRFDPDTGKIEIEVQGFSGGPYYRLWVEPWQLAKLR